MRNNPYFSKREKMNKLLVSIVKQVIGIDVGKEKFYACFKVLYSDGKIEIKGTKSFDNTLSGLCEFYVWYEKRMGSSSIPAIFVMEATGVYYEEIAYFLHEKDQQVSVQLPTKLKYYAKSRNITTKNDRVDSKLIAEYGIERNFKPIEIWEPPSKNFKIIRDLSREHSGLKSSIIAAKAQLHSLTFAKDTFGEVIDMKRQQIEFYESHVKQVEDQIEKLVSSDESLEQKVQKLTTIKGIRFMTAIKILAETNGFKLFTSIRQLVSYAGLDVVEKESGSYKGKTRISKRGNARIRAALYMPALTASQHNKTLKAFYERVNKGGEIKRKGLVAVMRKLLILLYTLWKKDEEYIEDYKQEKGGVKEDKKHNISQSQPLKKDVKSKDENKADDFSNRALSELTHKELILENAGKETLLE